MDRFSTSIQKRILKSYLRDSKQVVRVKATEKHPSSYLSDLELYLVDGSVWFLGKQFTMINKGVVFHIPSGFCVCFDRELNLLSRLLLHSKYHRVILVLVWFRDVLEYELKDIRFVLDSVLKEEGFGRITRSLILLTLRLV